MFMPAICTQYILYAYAMLGRELPVFVRQERSVPASLARQALLGKQRRPSQAS